MSTNEQALREALRTALPYIQMAANSHIGPSVTEQAHKDVAQVRAALALPAVEAVTGPSGTPSSQWRANGEVDPHAGHYDGERAALCMGDLTDDELANGAFMNYDRPFDIDAILTKKPGYHPPIAWMTAVKDRIRWLSRSLEKALQSPPVAAPADGFKVVPVEADENYAHPAHTDRAPLGFNTHEASAWSIGVEHGMALAAAPTPAAATTDGAAEGLAGWQSAIRSSAIFSDAPAAATTTSEAAVTEAIPAHLDVRRVMLSVSPGWDGMGEEIYAKSTADVEKALSDLDAKNESLQEQLDRLRAAPSQAHGNSDTASFKNFHRSLCDRFDYCHDEIDWRRDLVSLEEHIAKQISTPFDVRQAHGKSEAVAEGGYADHTAMVESYHARIRSLGSEVRLSRAAYTMGWQDRAQRPAAPETPGVMRALLANLVEALTLMEEVAAECYSYGDKPSKDDIHARWEQDEPQRYAAWERLQQSANEALKLNAAAAPADGAALAESRGLREAELALLLTYIRPLFDKSPGSDLKAWCRRVDAALAATPVRGAEPVEPRDYSDGALFHRVQRAVDPGQGATPEYMRNLLAHCIKFLPGGDPSIPTKNRYCRAGMCLPKDKEHNADCPNAAPEASEQDKVDAARYQWMRANAHPLDGQIEILLVPENDGPGDHLYGARMDSAIDAALAESDARAALQAEKGGDDAPNR